MKPVSIRMPPRMRGALLALAVGAMATQVSGASAAAQMGSARRVAPVAAVARAPLPAEHAQRSGLASLLRGPPVSGSWALLVAGLMGAWAIGQRRASTLGSRSLDAQRSGRR